MPRVLATHRERVWTTTLQEALDHAGARARP